MNELNNNAVSTDSINHDVCLLLGKLARKGAVVKWAVNAGANIATCEVCLIRDGARTSVLEMPRNIAQRAKQDGLLMPCANGDDWKLSKKGARTLRAIRSAGEGGQIKSATPGGLVMAARPIRQHKYTAPISLVTPSDKPSDGDQDEAGKRCRARRADKTKCST